MKIERDPSGKRPLRYDTKFWSHFGHGDGWSYGRCNRCVEHVYTTHTASEDTVNCWKILIFEDAVTDFEAVKRYLMERAEEDKEILGKWGRGQNSLAVIYTKSELDRDRVKASIYRDLKQRGLLKSGYFPYRRGCKSFEKILGPWRDWEAPKQKPEAIETSPQLVEYEED